MVRAPHWSSEGCEFNPRWGAEIVFLIYELDECLSIIRPVNAAALYVNCIRLFTGGYGELRLPYYTGTVQYTITFLRIREVNTAILYGNRLP